MPGDATETRPRGADRLGAVIWGRRDPRIRATWRVLLPWPVLWFLAGSIGVVVAGSVVPGSVSGPTGILTFGLFQAAFSGAAWVAWARYVDHRPLANYGFSLSRSWVLDLLVGFLAVLAGFGVWHAVGTRLGWTSLEVVLADPGPAFAYGLAALFVGVLVNAGVQELVFYGVTLTNAAEGLASRGVTPSRAVLGAWAVAAGLFALKHRPPTVEEALVMVAGLGIFGLLYVHTGELALSIGVHTGVNYAGKALFVAPSLAGGRLSVFQANIEVSGFLGTLAGGAIPQLVVAYLLLIGWLRWRHGRVIVDTASLARWRESWPAEVG